MSPEQLIRLATLRDKLIDTALIDADPNNWTAAGVKPGEMTKEERGDAKWCRSLAVSTVALTMQVQRLMQEQEPAGRTPENEDAALEKEIKQFEAAAAQVLAKARGAA